MRPTPQQQRQNRKRRIRAMVQGTVQRPRLTVHRSHTRLSVQLIDDVAGRTLVAATSIEAKGKPNAEGAAKLGTLLATKAKDAKITTVVFDRNGYKYHGTLAALADAAREGGLQF